MLPLGLPSLHKAAMNTLRLQRGYCSLQGRGTHCRAWHKFLDSQDLALGRHKTEESLECYCYTDQLYHSGCKGAAMSLAADSVGSSNLGFVSASASFLWPPVSTDQVLKFRDALSSWPLQLVACDSHTPRPVAMNVTQNEITDHRLP